MGKTDEKSINNAMGEQNALPSFNMSKYEKKSDKTKYDNLAKKDIKKQKFSLKNLAIFILLAIILMTALFTFKFINFNAMVLIWRINVTRGSDDVNNKSIRYSSFKNGLMRVSNDGVTYVDEYGAVRFTISYNMKEPVYEENDGYFFIADKNAYNFYIFDTDGLVGSNTTTYPIVKISAADGGVLYILQSDENNSYINVYRSNGNPIDIIIKTNLSEDGMPIDINTSSSGEELIVSSVSLSDTDIYTKATYYNFSDAGKNANSKRIVKEFVNEFEDKFLARGYFFNDKNSCLIYDGGVKFVSTADESNPRIVSDVQFDDRIRSISYNHEYLAIVFEDNKLRVFNDSGNLICDKQIDFDYENFYISDNYVIFIYENRVMIYDTRGRMIFDKEVRGQLQYVAKKKSLLFTELLVGLTDAIECLRFY